MTTFKRPASIIVFSILMLLAAVVSVLINAYINMLPLWGSGNIFTRLSVMDCIVLAVYPLSAVSIFSVRKPGWWIFIVSAAFLFVNNIIAFVRNPMISFGGLVIFNIMLFIIAGFFFRKHIIAPYFNPRLRWWEQACRYNIDLGVSLENGDALESGYLEDLSLGGCFIRIPDPAKVGGIYPVRIFIGEALSISVSGRVMRIITDDCSLPGLGIMFINLSDVEKAGLAAMLETLVRIGFAEESSAVVTGNKREFSRQIVNISISLNYLENILPARLVNFSSTGACIEMPDELRVGKACRFSCTIGYDSLDIGGIIRWKRNVEGGWQYGISFDPKAHDKRSSIKNILSTIRKLGGNARTLNSGEYEHLIDEGLSRSPYRFLFRKKFKREQ